MAEERSDLPSPVEDGWETPSERRSSARVPLDRPVRIGSPGGLPFATVSARDLSANGLFIDSERDVRVGARFSVEVPLSADERVYVSVAEVVDNRVSTSGSGFGVRFVEVASEARVALENAIQARAQVPLRMEPEEDEPSDFDDAPTTPPLSESESPFPPDELQEPFVLPENENFEVFAPELSSVANDDGVLNPAPNTRWSKLKAGVTSLFLLVRLFYGLGLLALLLLGLLLVFDGASSAKDALVEPPRALYAMAQSWLLGEKDRGASAESSVVGPIQPAGLLSSSDLRSPPLEAQKHEVIQGGASSQRNKPRLKQALGEARDKNKKRRVKEKPKADQQKKRARPKKVPRRVIRKPSSQPGLQANAGYQAKQRRIPLKPGPIQKGPKLQDSDQELARVTAEWNRARGEAAEMERFSKRVHLTSRTGPRPPTAKAQRVGSSKQRRSAHVKRNWRKAQYAVRNCINDRQPDYYDGGEEGCGDDCTEDRDDTCCWGTRHTRRLTIHLREKRAGLLQTAIYVHPDRFVVDVEKLARPPMDAPRSCRGALKRVRFGRHPSFDRFVVDSHDRIYKAEANICGKRLELALTFY